MAETLTYSQDVKGWPSFYSYIPEWMAGMNNYFYSFKGGNLYRHNTNEVRNQYYGVNYSSQMTSIFNDNPTDNSLWKTMELESDQAWEIELETDIQNGYIDEAWFEKKEAVFFAFVRNPDGENGEPALTIDPSQYVLRSVNGIGSNTTVAAGVITFGFPVGSVLSIGDILYTIDPGAPGVPLLVGPVTAFSADRTEVSFTLSAGGINPQDTWYMMGVKNAQAESHGVLGHYCKFIATNSSTTATELFVVESQMMKSYP